MEIFTIYDSVAEVYMKPIFCKSAAEVIRLLKMELDNDNSMIAKNPEDFVCYKIGEFDEHTGEIQTNKHTKIIACIELSPNFNKPQVVSSTEGR